MLFVTLDRGRTHNRQYDWHVGEKFTFRDLDDMELVESVQADGDELEVILQTCRNIPATNGRVVTWYGDDAKFIVQNVVMQRATLDPFLEARR